MSSKKIIIPVLVLFALCVAAMPAQAAKELMITDTNFNALEPSTVWTTYSYGYVLPWPNTLDVPQSRNVKKMIGSISGTKIGDGECVSFVKYVTKRTDLSANSNWKRGSSLFTYNVIRPGTAVATFNANGGYNGGHTAIFRDYYYENGKRAGIVVWDQNYLPDHYGTVAKHVIKCSGSGVNDADSYYTVVIPY